MADYSKFAQFQKEVAYAAINRHMVKDSAFTTGDIDSGYLFQNAHERIPGPKHGPTGKLKIRWTDENGVSGDYEIDPWEEIYKPWIDKIERLFASWDKLPDPSHFRGPIENLQEAVWRLTLTPGDKSEGGSPIGNVAIGTSVDFVNKWIQPGTPGAFSGQTVIAFDNAYGGARMRLVIGNQREAMIVLGLGLAGEQKLWLKAREDLLRLTDEAKKAFEGADTNPKLTVVNALVDLAAAFFPGAKALGPIAKAGGFVEKLMPKPAENNSVSAELSGNRAEDVYGKLREALNKLRTTITDTERELDKMLDGMLDEMVVPSRHSSFHIHPDIGLDQPFTDAGKITIKADLSVFRTIGYQEMPEIAAELLHSGRAAQSAVTSSPWTRLCDAGHPSTLIGAYTTWHELFMVTWSAVNGTAAELVEAGRALAAAAGYLQDSDGAAAKTLGDLGKDIAGVPLGWDVRDPIPQLPGGSGSP